MILSEPQIGEYHEKGFLLIENVFSRQGADTMLKEMHNVIAEDCPRRILEKNGQVRSFFAPELSSDLFNEVIRHEKLVTPSRQLIGNKVYVHQTKLNTKFAMEGDWWEWHQDYTFWRNDDGMPEPDVITAMIFLNDVNEFNGPLLLIPGSHQTGILDGEENNDMPDDESGWFSQYKKSTEYMTALTADLKYTLKKNTIAKWAATKGLYSAKGAAGSVLFFHGNIFHASANNISPWDRHTFLVTYNSIDNVLPAISNPRPDFIASRNFAELMPAGSGRYNL